MNGSAAVNNNETVAYRCLYVSETHGMKSDKKSKWFPRMCRYQAFIGIIFWFEICNYFDCKDSLKGTAPAEGTINITRVIGRRKAMHAGRAARWILGKKNNAPLIFTDIITQSPVVVSSAADAPYNPSLPKLHARPSCTLLSHRRHAFHRAAPATGSSRSSVRPRALTSIRRRVYTVFGRVVDRLNTRWVRVTYCARCRPLKHRLHVSDHRLHDYVLQGRSIQLRKTGQQTVLLVYSVIEICVQLVVCMTCVDDKSCGSFILSVSYVHSAFLKVQTNRRYC